MVIWLLLVQGKKLSDGMVCDGGFSDSVARLVWMDCGELVGGANWFMRLWGNVPVGGWAEGKVWFVLF